MRVLFNRDWDWTPKGKRQVTIGYKAGRAYTLPTPAGRKAIAEGAGERVAVPPRGAGA